MTDLGAWEANHARLLRRKKRYGPDAKPPQKQCKFFGDHVPHLFEYKRGLIWSCQGRGHDG